jgi:hypothetical protein
MFDDDQHDEELARELLGILSDDFSEPPDELPDRTIRKIEAELTSRDLLDLTTFVFLMSFCAPILDLFAAFFGYDIPRRDGMTDAPVGRSRNTRTSDSTSSSTATDGLFSDETNQDSHDE